MDLELAGKTVIVTGGSGGIGRGLVLEFARAGANVVSADIDAGAHLADEAARQGITGRIHPVIADITSRAGAMVAAANAAFGPVDVLVNNAGGATVPTQFEQLTPEDRRWEIALNCDGTVNCCQAVAYEWGPKGVRVNNISPGWIVPHSDDHVGRQSFWNRFGFDMMGTTAGMQEALEAGRLFNMQNLAIKRLGRPEDIA